MKKSIVKIAALFICLSLGLSLAGCSTPKTASQSTPESTLIESEDEVSESPKDNAITFDTPFEFDDLEITLHDEYSFDTLQNQFSDHDGAEVVVIPASITNISDKTHGLNMFLFSVFNPSGQKADDISTYFENSVGYGAAGEMRAGATTEADFVILYEGDGDYYIEFDNYSEIVEVKLPISK